MEVKAGFENFRLSKAAPVDKIRPSKPVPYVDSSECEMRLQIGIFFDGTGNNLYLHEKMKSHSNVARLYQSYSRSSREGTYAEYIPGLGTPFPFVGEYFESRFGSAFALGGDSRVLFALLRVFDVIHISLFRSEMFDPPLRKALCTHSPSDADKKLLRGVGLLTSLVDGDDMRVRISQYLDMCATVIYQRAKLAKTPKICECSVDVFGFSRGATEARVFCAWLGDLLSITGLAGIPLRLRFLGLMDTVASVGIWEGIKNDQMRRTGGHGNWATPYAMQILPEVENCVHMVAMHELRKNFPVDSVLVDRELPHNCLEFAYPGSHSDVGGGYAPGELGVAMVDSSKLSQIPLNHLYDCAVAAGVPLSKKRFAVGGSDFDIDKNLLKAFKEFVEISTEAPRSLGNWMLPYLVWRWQSRLLYHQTGHVKKANSEDFGYLMASNQQFCRDDEEIQRYVELSKPSIRIKRPYDRDGIRNKLLALEPEASALRARVVAQPKVPVALAEFFDNFVHDSLAGFRKQYVEPTGYWRYRRVFRGSTTPYIG